MVFNHGNIIGGVPDRVRQQPTGLNCKISGSATDILLFRSDLASEVDFGSAIELASPRKNKDSR
jgi:hypothetical protein